MGTFVCYAPIPVKDIKKSIKPTISGLRKWFKDNPQRKDCLAEFWYGNQIRVTPDNFEKIVKQEADKACKETLKMNKKNK